MNAAAQVRDLFLVRDAERQQREHEVQEAVKKWAAGWMPASAAWSPKLDVACSTEAALALEAMSWRQHGSALAGEASRRWSAQEAGSVQRLAALMAGREGGMPLTEGDWSHQAAQTALQELHTAILGAVHGAAQATAGRDDAQPDVRRLSGAVLVRERSLGLAWVWQPVAAQPKSVGAAPLAPLTASLAGQSVRVGVDLGEVEIEVGELLALQAGDVIRFPVGLKGPMPVHVGSTPASARDRAALHGQLGQVQGHVAIQLQSGPAA